MGKKIISYGKYLEGEMKRLVGSKGWLFLALLGVAAGCAFPQVVYAQVEPILSVLPEQSEVPLGNDINLELSIYAGSEVNAFDVTVQYDPGILTLTEWQHGDYLSNLTVVNIENDPGILRIAATQLATPAVSGNGILLVMTFNVIGIGQSQIEILEAVFADSDGNSTEPVRIDGIVAGIDSSTYTPTPTITLTPTPTLTQTLVPTGTETPDPNMADTATLAPTQPVPATETAPVSEGQSPVHTATDTPDGEIALEEQAGSESDILDEGQTSDPDSDGTWGGVEDEEGNGTPGEDIDPESRTSNSDARDRTGQLNLLLWAVLIASSFAIIMMVMIIIHRRKHREEGLLL